MKKKILVIITITLFALNIMPNTIITKANETVVKTMTKNVETQTFNELNNNEIENKVNEFISNYTDTQDVKYIKELFTFIDSIPNTNENKSTYLNYAIDLADLYLCQYLNEAIPSDITILASRLSYELLINKIEMAIEDAKYLKEENFIALVNVLSDKSLITEYTQKFKNAQNAPDEEGSVISPVNFIVSDTTSTSITVKWESTKPISECSVGITEGNYAGFSGITCIDAQMINVSNDTNSYTFTGLNPNTDYRLFLSVTGSDISDSAIYLNVATTKDTDGSLKASVNYSTYIENEGWQNYVKDGATSGTVGKSLGIQQIKIRTSGDSNLCACYSTFVKNKGWQDYVYSNNIAGTSGNSIEAIKIKLTDELVSSDASKYDIYYRVYAQHFGWLGWAKNNEPAGTEGYGYRIEAIEIKLVAKGKEGPKQTGNSFKKKTISVNYSTHVQKKGWQKYVSNGAMSGTFGKSLRLEAIKIKIANQDVPGNIQYSTHVQKKGWQKYVSNDAMSGTSGKSLRLEAIKIKLTDKLAEKYDIYYRVHAQHFGWLGWAKNGQPAGTEGYSYRLEGIEIKLVEKNGLAPGSTKNCFYKK